MQYENKYHLTPQESLFLAKKKWDENVYCGMKMENRAITFPQTKTILDGINVGSVALDDVQAVLNMREAWKYLIATIECPITLDYICKLNEFVARNEALAWGVLRTGKVSISGTDYIPMIPEFKATSIELENLLNQPITATNRALSLFLWGARSQLFWDGNKRTSLLLANKILLQAGAGMLTIKENDMLEFNELLCSFYTTNEAEPIKTFLYQTSISGLEY